jgi:hypothetical protein
MLVVFFVVVVVAMLVGVIVDVVMIVGVVVDVVMFIRWERFLLLYWGDWG